jgi:MFS transporter, DHA2 family, multidrug resistance protein
VAVVVGVVTGVVFVRRQHRLYDPLMDLKLFRNRTISTSLVAQLSYRMMGGGLMLLMSVFLQLVEGMSTSQAGGAMVPGMATGAIGFLMVRSSPAGFAPATSWRPGCSAWCPYSWS